MPKQRKLREYTRCPHCLRAILLRSISSTTVPKHRDRYDPSSLCPGSGEPLQRVFRRRI